MATIIENKVEYVIKGDYPDGKYVKYPKLSVKPKPIPLDVENMTEAERWKKLFEHFGIECK